jgi:hypothetical protein
MSVDLIQLPNGDAIAPEGCGFPHLFFSDEGGTRDRTQQRRGPERPSRRPTIGR